MISISSKKIKRFILKFLLFAIIILACDRSIGIILSHFYFLQESGSYYRTTYSIDSTFADILVFGSSRANHSYVPEIFEKRLSSSFYNTGKDGNFILYNYAVFKAIISRYNPKLIIFDINPEDLSYSATDYERLSSLLPYYKSHPEIRDILDLRGPFERIKHVSGIYPYNSLVLLIAIGNLEYNKLRKSDNKGYIPLIKKMANNKIDTIYNTSQNIDENKICALNDIFTICQEKSIDLILVYSPTYTIIQKSYANDVLVELSLANGIKYFNLSNSPEFINNPSYFADKNHLNDVGAGVFSNVIIDKIMIPN